MTPGARPFVPFMGSVTSTSWRGRERGEGQERVKERGERERKRESERERGKKRETNMVIVKVF